jgi:protein tyrosine phosphatase type 4A
MHFDDGDSPPQDIIERWNALVHEIFDKNPRAAAEEKPCIAIHCVAGLGRAPLMVAIALVEHGLDSISAVTFIRERRYASCNIKIIPF